MGKLECPLCQTKNSTWTAIDNNALVNHFTDFHRLSKAGVDFVFKPKPWQYGCNHIWKEEYFKYLDLTPWRGERPEFIFRSFVNYIFIPTVIRLLKKMKNVISFK